MPSELWDLALGKKDGNKRKDKRKTVEGSHNEDEEADERRKKMLRESKKVSAVAFLA